jgi:hypothetical protein
VSARPEITAGLSVALWVGDNVATSAASRIVAGTGITLRGDTRRKDKTNDVDDTNADLLAAAPRWTCAARSVRQCAGDDREDLTEIYGHIDVDTFTFNQTKLDANTTVSAASATRPALANDGEDCFVVNQLQSMNVDRNGIGDTLTLDGQSPTPTITRSHTSGSWSADPQNFYVITVLDTGAKDKGVDELVVFGVDTPHTGIDPATGSRAPTTSSRCGDELDTEAKRRNPRPSSRCFTPNRWLRRRRAPARRRSSAPRNYDANLNGRLIGRHGERLLRGRRQQRDHDARRRRRQR